MLEDAEVEGYGGTALEGDIALRDLDGDGRRDLIVRQRGETRMRSFDDEEEESFRDPTHTVSPSGSRGCGPKAGRACLGWGPMHHGRAGASTSAGAA